MNSILEKQGIPVFIDNITKEPLAILYFNKEKRRSIYLVKEASEEQIIELLNKPFEFKETKKINN